MKIAIIGYGKMGKVIEEIAVQRGHEIVLKIDSKNTSLLTATSLKTANVAIEFTNPHSAFENLKVCINNTVPVVCGSTGWLNRLNDINELCRQKNGSFLHASNFSVGVNIFFELNKKLASLMAKQPSYNVEIEEIHHTAKKDAPSGTAVSLAEQILQYYPQKNGWVNERNDSGEKLSIISKRIDPAPGTHYVRYRSNIDDIELTHTAHNRLGFATGAVLAAEYIADKPGIHYMKDVLGF